MPLFEYECASCHHTFELLVRESTTLECPSCKGTEIEKQLSVFAVSTAGSRPDRRDAAPGPCGACGHPDGPGSCSVN